MNAATVGLSVFLIDVLLLGLVFKLIDSFQPESRMGKALRLALWALYPAVLVMGGAVARGWVFPGDPGTQSLLIGKGVAGMGILVIAFPILFIVGVFKYRAAAHPPRTSKGKKTPLLCLAGLVFLIVGAFVSVSLTGKNHSGDPLADCRAGNQEACGIAGMESLLKKDYPAAREFFEKGCEKNDPNSCFGLGMLHERGFGVEKSQEKAISYLEKAGDMGVTKAYLQAGLMYSGYGGFEKDLDKADEYFKKACDRKEGDGCLYSGMAGRFTAQNKAGIYPEKQIEAIRKSCELKSGSGCRVLGDFYFEGRGIERSADKAKEAYEKSCSYQNPYGCESVGILYDEGIAVPKSEKEAFGYYKKALSFFEKQCGELDSRACVEAGDYHADGVGTERSAEKAREFYKTACDRDDETGCSKLSKLNR